jgi:hypothetical protein
MSKTVKTSKTNFIEYLDSFKERNGLDYYTMANILHLTNMNYIENLYFTNTFTGDSAQSCYPSSYRTRSSSRDDYELWKKKHEAVFSSTPDDFICLRLPNPIPLNDNPGPVTPPPNKYQEIDDSINDLGDMLDVLKKYPYSPDTEYNIDLKSLSAVETELHQLNAMIGMNSLKAAVLDQLVYFMQDLHITRGASDFKHTVLYGPPGTGKTEIAKIIGTMYSKLGILKNNVFKKVTRNDLVAGYLGQTAIKTRKVIDECLGGVLFIDEAYALANHYDDDIYSKECIDTLCEALSDHKNDLMVIIAGYEEDLNASFFKANKGMESRFIWRFTIEPYTAKEMAQIFKKQVIESEWTVPADLTDKWFEQKKGDFPHYGRSMEILFSYIKIAHARRVYGKPKEQRKILTLDDTNNGYQTFLKHKKPEDKTKKIFQTMYL